MQSVAASILCSAACYVATHILYGAALTAIDRSHISYGAALAAFVATSFCIALHMVKLRLYLESEADGSNHCLVIFGVHCINQQSLDLGHIRDRLV